MLPARSVNSLEFLLIFGGVLRGNTIRGNRPERFSEGNLPLRGSLRGPLRGMVSELFRAFQRFSEVFRGFQTEVFQRPSQSPSQSAIVLSELQVVLPPMVLPHKTPTKFSLNVLLSAVAFQSFSASCLCLLIVSYCLVNRLLSGTSKQHMKLQQPRTYDFRSTSQVPKL